MTTHGRKDTERERHVEYTGRIFANFGTEEAKNPPCPNCSVTSLYRSLYIAYWCSNSVAAIIRVFWYVAPYRLVDRYTNMSDELPSAFYPPYLPTKPQGVDTNQYGRSRHGWNSRSPVLGKVGLALRYT